MDTSQILKDDTDLQLLFWVATIYMYGPQIQDVERLPSWKSRKIAIMSAMVWSILTKFGTVMRLPMQTTGR